MDTEFRKRIDAARQVLEGISEERSRETIREGGWTRKEVLGHLLDSAANNHVRIAFAATTGSYQGPSYMQQEWVDLNGYREMEWQSLIADWRTLNERITRMVERIPSERMGANCQVGSDAPVTLGFLIDDYLDHLEHHIRQF
jgi:hypothetical protein